MRKIILTTGGTGGHIFPAFAVAEELLKRDPQTEILFVGGEYGPEKRYCQTENLAFAGLPSRGFLGRGVKSIPAAFAMLRSILKAKKIIDEYKPDAIAGFGGYASFAPVFAGWLKKIPILLHEQNAIAGTGNKILGRMAQKICISWPNTRGFAKSTIFTGNPVRRQIHKPGEEGNKATRHLLVIGGSQGAHAINEFLLANLEKFKNAGIEILHQTGERDLPKVRRAYEKAGFTAAKASAFITDMGQAYEWASLVLCRAGATTCAELSASGLPAFFVPFPAAIHDHQTQNARVLVDNGSALMIPENSLSAETVEQIISLLNAPDQLQRMSLAATNLAKPEAAALLADELLEIAK